jgi:hypothetical protein
VFSATTCPLSLPIFIAITLVAGREGVEGKKKGKMFYARRVSFFLS